MKLSYLNQQDKFGPMNGKTIEQAQKLAELLDNARNKKPFVAWFMGENNFSSLQVLA
jgi:ABC-type Fe3+/spermidine/putrescine transport system ATPase subunit